MGTAETKILQDTLQIINQGYYNKHHRKVILKLSKEQMAKTKVFLPLDVAKISSSKDFPHIHQLGRMGVGCFNSDSFVLARKRTEGAAALLPLGHLPVLVLNFANPVRPGRGVRTGAKAQEEDLCRASSLLVSLESEEAGSYYSYNKSQDSSWGSDAVMITPEVEIIKDEYGNLLDESVVVAVMTCAAPLTKQGLDAERGKQYEDMLFQRIMGMLKVAAYSGYQMLVLGAFGCGVYGNDAHLVSDLFYRALKEFRFDGMVAKDFFRRVDFAVWDHSPTQYNYKEFSRNFKDFYREENERETQRALEYKRKTEAKLDQIKGCLLGGAAGDALGYAVEFMSEQEIFGKFGKQGITEYQLDHKTGKALISDDTQMSLFTANGILVGDTRGSMRGIQGYPRSYVARAYREWYWTQIMSMQEVHSDEWCSRYGKFSWLLDIEELYARRAPGNTCLSALRTWEPRENYIETRVNQSKGCGGIMRVAPLALKYDTVEMDILDFEGAQLAAITHGHSLGYMPAAVLVHVINRIVFSSDAAGVNLKKVVVEARDKVSELFQGDPHLKELVRIINLALDLAENDDEDLHNIHEIGEGWVAEETLGIALYCSLRHQRDFTSGITAAVNHKGDSDSTGAVTGNILGAYLGYEAIEEKWQKNLELSDVLLEMATDLCHGCQMSEFSHYKDKEWIAKYMNMCHPVHEENKQPQFRFFWLDNEENGELSNWYPRKFVIDDFQYLHVEQYIMAQKAKLFHDAESYTKILRATTPKECKALGKNVVPFDAAKWDLVKYEIGKTANRAKYMQNPDLMDFLLSTGDAVLAEASPYDRIWGIGLDAETAGKTEQDQWPGENLLGTLLMELRSEFQTWKTKEPEIRVRKGDITKVYDAEAIVNAANKSLLGGGGVDGAIHKAAGPELLQECAALKGCSTGEAKLTKGYNLPSKYVIHTVGPVWTGGLQEEKKLLGDCYRSALQVAADHDIRSIAFPSISTGVYGFPVDAAAQIAVKAVYEFISAHPGRFERIEWVLYDDQTLSAYTVALENQYVNQVLDSPVFDHINRLLSDGMIE